MDRLALFLIASWIVVASSMLVISEREADAFRAEMQELEARLNYCRDQQ